MRQEQKDTGWIIKADDLFYDGNGGYVQEYPDAHVYRSRPKDRTVKQAFEAAEEMGFNGTDIDVIHNYGFEYEQYEQFPVSRWLEGR